jgi:hypothetical protein
MPLSAADLEDLRRARELLENPGLAMKVTNVLGLPVEKAFEILPRWLARIVGGSTRALLRAALAVGCSTFGSKRIRRSKDPVHKALVATSGAIGGLFGIAGLPIELPISTAIMLRSIADVARSEGEDVDSKETREACLQVFALGGRSRSDDAAETGYFAARAILARALGEAAEFVAEKGIVQEGAPVLVRLLASFASRSSVAVSEKALLQFVPILGAAGGATVNLLFIAHFQKMARGHFIVRRLERTHGGEEVRRAYEGRVTAVIAPPKLLARPDPPRIARPEPPRAG